jgi:outer membrane immunogenic protein
MRLNVLNLAAIVAAFCPLGALAADLPSKAAPPVFSPAPAANWAGFYAGSFVGGALSSVSTRQAASASGTAFGGTVGTLVGYNWQSGALVYGLEGDIGSNYLTREFSAKPGLVGNKVDSLYSLHARARLGYDMGWFMPFVAGGFAYNRTDQYQQAPLDFNGQSRTLPGWTIGAGVDAKVTLPVLGPAVLRAEYLYESMPTSSYNLNGPTLRTDLSTHYARVALISTIGDKWRASPEVIPADWAGFYFGAIGGGADQRITTKGMGVSPAYTASGVIGGIYTGHNWMFCNTMLGYEGATMLANVTGHGPQPGAASTNYTDFVEGDFRGRAGYAFGRFMPFVAAGVAYGTSEQTDNMTGADKGSVPTVAGTIGVGLDYMASDRIALRAEYLYSHSLMNEDTHLDNDTCCSQSRDSNSVRLGVAYFFH